MNDGTELVEIGHLVTVTPDEDGYDPSIVVMEAETDFCYVDYCFTAD